MFRSLAWIDSGGYSSQRGRTRVRDPVKVVGATGFEPATFRSPSRRELVATVGRPLGAYPPFPAACPCIGDHSRPAPPLTDPSERDSRTRFLTQDSPDRPTHDRCAAEATDAGGAAVGM